MLINPFIQRKTIRSPENFIGRKNEVRQILQRVAQQNSVGILGNRRIGKSSLLYYLYQKGNEYLRDVDKKVYHFLYLSGQDSEVNSKKDFMFNILKEIDIDHTKEDFESNPDKVFRNGLKTYAKKKCLILLLDEFEEWTNADSFEDRFFKNLRFFCEQSWLTLITSSRKGLKDLTNEGNLTSPLWNIVYDVEIGEFSTQEMADFLLHYWNKDQLNATETEWDFLLDYPSLHPLILQIVSYWVLENRHLKLERKGLLQEIEKEIDSYFRDEMDNIKKWLYREIKQDNIRKTTKWIGDNLNNLNPLKGVINIKK